MNNSTVCSFELVYKACTMQTFKWLSYKEGMRLELFTHFRLNFIKLQSCVELVLCAGFLVLLSVVSCAGSPGCRRRAAGCA